MKEYDITVYGASGFTARHIISHLQKYPLRIALSARTPSKIQHNPQNYPVIQCDTDNLEIITSKSIVLLNCAGPYIRCGEAVVESCIDNNCHYVDITGETTFINNIIKKFGEKAKEQNVYILNCCGFDSVPCDISFDMLKRRIERKLKNDKQIGNETNQRDTDNKTADDSNNVKGTDILRTINNSVPNMHGVSIYNFLKFKDVKCNFATFESLVHGLASHFNKPKQSARESRRSKTPSKIIYSKERKCYCVIFMGTDHSVVTRSQKAFYEINDMPIVDFYIYMEVGGLLGVIVFMFFFTLIFWMARSELGRKILLKYPGFFTCGRVKHGLTREEIDKSSFEMNLYGYYQAADSVAAQNSEHSGRQMEHLSVRGPDPGYKTTPICMVECAILLHDRITNSKKFTLCDGGVVTPATLFYDTELVNRLNEEGIVFSFE